MTEKKSYIPSRLKNASVGGHVAGAADIYDDALEKTQEAINNDLYAPSEGIISRVETLEDQVHFSGSFQTENTPAGVTSGSGKITTSNAVRGAIDVRTGYFECATAGSTARKDVLAAGFVLTTGGHIKVKMTSANTADNATMNISPTSTIVSANTKTLYYNGEPASADNSWEAGEVISVYYDGTHYQASNAQGGGGKAEKIKYDNSASGLAAENVQEALDKVGKSFDYVTRNVPLIALNTNYSVDTILKDSKGAILRVIKPVTTLRNVETLAIGDLKTAGTSGTTYKAVAAIADYNSSAEYSEGAYARGTFASNALTVTVDTAAEGTITIRNGDEERSVSVDSESTAEGLATAIAALSFAGWTGSANEAVVTFTRSIIGPITNPFTIIVSSDAGVTVTSAYTNGTETVRKFDGSSWTVKTAAELKSDTNLFTAITSVEGEGNLIALATQPNSVTQDIKELETHLFSPENNNCLIFNNFKGSGYTVTFSINPTKITAVAPSTVHVYSRAYWDLRPGVSGTGVAKELIDGNTYYFRIKASSTKSVGLGFMGTGTYTLTKRLLTIPGGGSVDGIYTFVYDSSCPLLGFPKVAESTYGARIVIEEAYFCDYIPIEDRAVFKKDIVDGLNIKDEDKVLGAKAGKTLYQKISRYINLDLSKYSARTYAINGETLKWTSNQTYTTQRHIVIKVTPGRTYKVVKTQSRAQQDYTWLTTNTGTRNQDTLAPVLEGYGIMYMTSNDVYELTAPEGANYLYIRVMFGTEVPLYPTSVEAPEECMEIIEDLETRVTAVETMGAELIETIKPYSNTTMWAEASQWVIAADKTFGLLLRVDVPNTSIQIKSNTTNSSYYYFLKGIYGAGNEKPIDNCDGCSRVTITKNTTTNWIDVPDDCRFVWIGLNNATGTNYSPQEIKIKYYLKDKEQSKVDLGNYEESNSINIKIKNVRKNSAFTFLQFSDIHGDVANMYRISKLVNYYKDYIDVVINCGDTVDKTATESLSWYATAVNGIDKEVLDVVGNHDYWNSTSQTEENRGYNKIIKPLVQRDSTIIQPSNAEAEYKCYYYKDFGNIRLIVLSSFDTDSMRTWDEDQKSWLEDILDDAVSNNKQVIIANHATYSYQGNGSTGVSSDLVYANYNDYFTRRPNTFTEYRVSPSRYWTMSDEVLSCVKNFMDAGGTFICYLCGHTHRDLIVDVDDHETYGYQPMICISTSNSSKAKNSGVNNDGMELLVNIIGIDTTRSLIKLVRVGCNRDIFQQQKNEWVYNYDLHRMIVNN